MGLFKATSQQTPSLMSQNGNFSKRRIE